MKDNNPVRIGKFNIVDVVAVILVLLVVAYGAYRLLSREEIVVTTIPITYTARAEGVAIELYQTCQEHVPAQLIDRSGRINGQMESVTMEPYYVLGPDGQWVEDPYHVNLFFHCTANVPNEAVMFTKVGEQEVRIGKSSYIAKTEYVEFQNTTVIDIHWGE